MKTEKGLMKRQGKETNTKRERTRSSQTMITEKEKEKGTIREKEKYMKNIRLTKKGRTCGTEKKRRKRT